MRTLTPEQRLQIVQLYYEKYGQLNRFTERTIRNTFTYLKTQHLLLDNIRPNRPARSGENIALR